MLIVITPVNTTTHSAGDIIFQGNEEDISAWKDSPDFSSRYLSLPVPPELENKPIKILKIIGENERWTKDGNVDSFIIPLVSVETWTKDGETSVTEEPKILEHWTKEGEADLYLEPLLQMEHWSKYEEADVFTEPTKVIWTHTTTGDIVEVDPNDGANYAESIVADDSWTYTPEAVDTSWERIFEQVDISWTFSNPSVFDTSWTHYPQIISEWIIIEDTATSKTDAITALYYIMVADVIKHMEMTFATKDRDSAAANQESWKLMLASPAAWAAGNLTARHATTNLAVGDIMDTQVKVLEYATSRLEAVEAYGIWRFQRVDQFRIDKELLLENL